MIDKAIPQGFDGHLDHAQEEWLRLTPDGWDGTDYVAENASLRMERDFYFRQVEDNAKRSQAAYEALSDENVKLRDEFRKMDQWHSAELMAALDENAKLRGLLQRTWDAFHDATAKEFNDTKNELRELGVEVDA